MRAADLELKLFVCRGVCLRVLLIRFGGRVACSRSIVSPCQPPVHTHQPHSKCIMLIRLLPLHPIAILRCKTTIYCCCWSALKYAFDLLFLCCWLIKFDLYKRDPQVDNCQVVFILRWYNCAQIGRVSPLSESVPNENIYYSEGEPSLQRQKIANFWLPVCYLTVCYSDYYKNISNNMLSIIYARNSSRIT